MDEEEVRLYFDLSSLTPPHHDHHHVGCQHRLSTSPVQPQAPAFRFQFGSKKLLFLHGSRSEWIRTRIGLTEEVEEVREVREVETVSSESDEEDGEDTWRILQRVLRRVERNTATLSSSPSVCSRDVGSVEAESEADLLFLLLTQGCYDHILELVLSLLDWNSLQSLLSVEASWREKVHRYWRSARLVSRLEAHWRLFVPSQREVRWDREVSAMASDLRLLVVGFTGGGLVRYNRNNYSQDYFIIAHPNSTVVRLGFNTLHLVTAGADRLVKVWSLVGGAPVSHLLHSGSVQDMKGDSSSINMMMMMMMMMMMRMRMMMMSMLMTKMMTMMTMMLMVICMIMMMLMMIITIMITTTTMMMMITIMMTTTTSMMMMMVIMTKLELTRRSGGRGS